MNHFIEVKDTDGDTVVFRPDEISHVYRYEDRDSLVMKNGEVIEIPRGLVAFNTLPERTSHAGVRVLG